MVVMVDMATMELKKKMKTMMMKVKVREKMREKVKILTIKIKEHNKVQLLKIKRDAQKNQDHILFPNFKYFQLIFLSIDLVMKSKPGFGNAWIPVVPKKDV